MACAASGVCGMRANQGMPAPGMACVANGVCGMRAANRACGMPLPIVSSSIRRRRLRRFSLLIIPSSPFLSSLSSLSLLPALLQVRAKLQHIHNEMKSLMQSTHETFRNDVDEVQREWNLFVEQIDKSVEDSLRTTVKRSLQDLSRSINGDAKTEVQALFRIQVVLQMNKVEFKPSIADLTQTVNSVSKEAIATTSSMPRLTEALQEGKEEDPSSDRPSFYVQISNDEDILKVLVQVMTGMREILPKLQRYLNTWDRYKHIWDVDKDAFMRRYAKANRALTAFETDITRYKELQQDIQAEEGITNIGFIRIDCQPLKQALTAHCNTWQNKFTQVGRAARGPRQRPPHELPGDIMMGDACFMTVA